MSEEHNADERGTAERTASVNRRRFVKSLSVAGSATMLGTLGSAHVSAKSKNEESVAANADVYELQGKERTEAVDAALSDDGVQSLIEYHTVINSIKSDDAIAVSAPLDGERARIVRIPFNVDEEVLNEDVEKVEDPYILWPDSEDSSIIAAYIAHTKSGKRRAVNYHPPAASEEVKTQGISDGFAAPKKTENSLVQPQRLPTPLPTPPCGFGKTINWSCIEKAVSKNPRVSRSCSTCVAALATGANPVSVIACGWCAYDIITKGVTNPRCNLCKGFL